MITVASLAALAGCGSAASGAHGRAPGNEVTVSMGHSSGTPDFSAPDGPVVVTEADDGRTVQLRVGQRLRVVLGGRGEQWDRPASSGPAVRLTAVSGGYPTGHPADAVFLAVRAGTASVSSITDYACLHAEPACKIAQRVWAISATVTKSS